MVQDNNSSKEDISKRENFKNSICYIPFVAIWLFFSESNRSHELNKNIKYWTFLLIVFIIIRFIIDWILMIPIWWILFIIYAWTTWFLWFKAYKWEKIDIEYIDKFEEKVKQNMK